MSWTQSIPEELRCHNHHSLGLDVIWPQKSVCTLHTSTELEKSPEVSWKLRSIKRFSSFLKSRFKMKLSDQMKLSLLSKGLQVLFFSMKSSSPPWPHIFVASIPSHRQAEREEWKIILKRWSRMFRIIHYEAAMYSKACAVKTSRGRCYHNYGYSSW